MIDGDGGEGKRKESIKRLDCDPRCIAERVTN
jgi:hypothetical protein